MKTQTIFILFSLSSAVLSAQKEYSFGSTGQQKLLLNPAFCSSSQGLELQTLVASYPYPKANTSTFVNYTGVSYSIKKLSIGLSNTYYSNTYSSYQYIEQKYYSNKHASDQTDLSLAYSVQLKSGITLVPSIQASYFTLNENYKNTTFYTNGGRISAGILADIKKTFTFGVAFYDMNKQNTGYTSRFLNGSQFYHASVFLLKDKKVTLQPYVILKAHYFNDNYHEEGAYISYKNMSLQFGLRTFFTGFGSQYHFRENQMNAMAGINYTYKKIRVGYTFYFYTDPAQEIFISLNLLNKSAMRQRSLMLN